MCEIGEQPPWLAAITSVSCSSHVCQPLPGCCWYTRLSRSSRPRFRSPASKLSVDQLKAQVRVTAGRRLRPQSWPNGGRVAVALSFDVDNMSASLARGDLAPGVLSRGEYGALDGLPRVLRLLDKYQLPASFFIPAVSDALHPQMIRGILASGRHEVARARLDTREFAFAQQ